MTMKHLAVTSAVAAALATAGCVPSAPEPTPAPAPAPAPAPPPPVAPAPAPAYDNWMDAPQTPGDWRYAAGSGTTEAVFARGGAPALLVLRCDLSRRMVDLVLPGAAPGLAQLRIRAESAERVVDAQVIGGSLTASLAAADPLLDAIAFSKGRFAVESAGRTALYVPAYPEISRVIEDCRRGPI